MPDIRETMTLLATIYQLLIGFAGCVGIAVLVTWKMERAWGVIMRFSIAFVSQALYLLATGIIINPFIEIVRS